MMTANECAETKLLPLELYKTNLHNNTTECKMLKNI